MEDSELPPETQAVRRMFDSVPAVEAKPPVNSPFDDLTGRGSVRVNGTEIIGTGGRGEPTSEVQKTFDGIVMNNGILTHARVDGTLGNPVSG